MHYLSNVHTMVLHLAFPLRFAAATTRTAQCSSLCVSHLCFLKLLALLHILLLLLLLLTPEICKSLALHVMSHTHLLLLLLQFILLISYLAFHFARLQLLWKLSHSNTKHWYWALFLLVLMPPVNRCAVFPRALSNVSTLYGLLHHYYLLCSVLYFYLHPSISARSHLPLFLVFAPLHSKLSS